MNIFDFDIEDASSATMTEEEFVEKITPKLKEILKKEFPMDPQKQIIKIFPKQRIQFACPFCGDSAKNSYAKRGNFILEDGQFKNMFKCFNCGKFMSIKEFFNCYRNKLTPEEILYIEDKKHDSSIIEQESNKIIKNILLDVDKIETLAIDRETLKTKLDLEECNISNYGNYYLQQRNMFKYDYFLYDRKIKGLYVLNLTPSGKIIGFQIRNLSRELNIPKYRTYRLDRIYGDIFEDADTAIKLTDEINTISVTFNILNIDISKPVIVTEGPIDSFFLDNAVASCGSTRRIPLDIPLYYLFDDDEAGRKEALSKLRGGQYVFLWDKMKKDYNIPDREKWDINDIVNYFIEKKEPIPNFYKYFSKDKLDMIFV